MMTLRTIVPGELWHAQQPLRFGPLQLTTRMTVVRLGNGGLWIHSPLTPSDDIRSALREIGPVRFVVAPNKSHHLFLREFLEAYPEAQAWIAPGLADKRADLADFTELGGASPWDTELYAYFIRGLPIINETAWFHRATRTLILTDLLFCFGKVNPWLSRYVARALGVLGELSMSRTMKLAVKDRAALAASIRPLRALPVERIVLAHDQIMRRSELALGGKITATRNDGIPWGRAPKSAPYTSNGLDWATRCGSLRQTSDASTYSSTPLPSGSAKYRDLVTS